MDVARLDHEWRRERLVTGAVVVLVVAALALSLGQPWIVLFLLVFAVPQVRRGAEQALSRMTRSRVEERTRIATQRAARARHPFVSSVVFFGGRPAVLSYGEGHFYVTEAASADELARFDAGRVREVNFETTRIAARRDDGQVRALEGARLVIYLDDMQRPLIQLEFGAHALQAREWQARLRAAKAGTQTVVQEPGGVQVVREVKVRCAYCGTLADQGMSKCPACGAPI